MDSFEWNKIFGAVLGAAFVVLGLTFLAEELYHPVEPEVQGIEIDVPEVAAAGGDAAPVGPEPIAPIFASATAEAGANVAKKCVACHVFEKGGQNKVGPALYGVLGRDIASLPDFGYSGALSAYGNGKQWTYEEMNGFLWKPKTHVKGTSMGFAGLRKVEDRANIIAYMNTLTDNPLPPPVAEAPAAEAAPAEGATQTAGEGEITPAANVTGTDAGIDTGSDVPGATVAPAGANALGGTQPGDAPAAEQADQVDGEVVPSVAAPNAQGTTSTSEGASLPVGGDAQNPRAGAQSTGGDVNTTTVPITPPTAGD